MATEELYKDAEVARRQAVGVLESGIRELTAIRNQLNKLEPLNHNRLIASTQTEIDAAETAANLELYKLQQMTAQVLTLATTLTDTKAALEGHIDALLPDGYTPS